MDWENYLEIAEALKKFYPDVSPIGMSRSELIEKVTALPGFAGEKQPNSAMDCLSLIMHNWIKLLGKEILSVKEEKMPVNKKYMLEITMESRAGEKHHYIKRSFPAEKGKIDLYKYGHPYTLFGTVEIGNLIGMDNCYLEIRFDGKGFPVYQNSFHTVKREFYNAHIDPYLKLPVSEGVEIVHTTFYLYVE